MERVILGIIGIAVGVYLIYNGVKTHNQIKANPEMDADDKKNLRYESIFSPILGIGAFVMVFLMTKL